MNLWPHLKRGFPLIVTSALLTLIVLGSLVLFILKMRADAIEDWTSNAGNLGSMFAEQVDHAMEALDGSLRTTVRVLHNTPADDLRARVTKPGFIAALQAERAELFHAALLAIADENGVVIAGSRGADTLGLSIADRDYFRNLRDAPDAGLVVSRPILSRATGAWTVFLARRLSASDGHFLGIVFIGVEPGDLMQTANSIVETPGQALSMFDRSGALLIRAPAPSIHGEIGRIIPASSEWHAIAAAGGGMYRSPGWFDDKPKYVAVRLVPHYPLAVNVVITEEAALARWRQRSIVIAAASAVALALIGALLHAQFHLRERLSRARIRSWLRGRRLSAKSDELANINKRFGLTLDYMAHGMALYDAQGRVVVSNHCYAELYGLRPDQIRPGMRVQDIFELRIAAGAYAGGAPDAYRNFALNLKLDDRIDHLANGRVIHIRTKRTDGGGWVTMQEDITERIASTERLSHMALHDGLTGLPNRAAFKKHLAAAASGASGPDDRSIVLLIDLDGFKYVNDTYGHDIGDQALVEVAARLSRAAAAAFVARLGGDEFVVMAKCCGCESTCASALAEDLMRTVRLPLNFDGRRISLTLSIGSVIIEGTGFDATHVLRRADLALLDAKNLGRDRWRMFDADMERRFDERAGLARELREAIEMDGLAVFYQPIVAASDRKIVCMEALVRWRHPTRGMISPTVFVPLAEETGLILQLGEWVMRRACLDAAAWSPDVPVAVNVSSLQISQPDFARGVSHVLATTGLPPQRLQIEITESVLLQRDRQTIAELHALHELGVSFALDDFGTGYASLAYLKSIPLDKVKIDKCFVDDICVDKQSVAIVGAVVALARGLGIVTTAEGVETQEQWDALRGMGVSTMQGFYFGKPRPISEIQPPGRRNFAA